MPATGEIEKKSDGIKPGRRGGARPGAGRPKGRKDAKTLEIEAAAREMGRDALKALLKVAQHSKDDKARVLAANAILERGYGKPKQPIEHSGEEGGPMEMHITHEIIDPCAAG